MAVLLGLGIFGYSVSVIRSARARPASFSAAATTSSPATSFPATSSPPTPSTSAPSVARPTPVAPGRSQTGPARTTSASAAPGVTPFVPTRLRIGALDVAAPVVQVISADRTLAPPDNPARVGWWLASALAGSPTGTTVVVGHVDSAATGPGALFRLDHVKAGETIELSSGGRRVTYRVDSLHFYAKTGGLPATLFAAGGPSRLVVVSCGGTFDTAKHSYRDNVVVTAMRSG